MKREPRINTDGWIARMGNSEVGMGFGLAVVACMVLALALVLSPGQALAADMTVYNITSDATACAGVVDFVGVRIKRSAIGACGVKVYDTVIAASASANNLIWESQAPAVPTDTWAANLTSGRVTTDALVYTGAGKIAGVKIWSTASGVSSVKLYDATSATGTPIWEAHGFTSNATTPYTTVGEYQNTFIDYLPAPLFKSFSSYLYADVSNCYAEVYYTTFGSTLCPTYVDMLPNDLYETTTNGLYVDVTNCTVDVLVSQVRGVTLTFLGTYYQGRDSVSGAVIEAATPGDTVTVSETFANYLLSNFPTQWSR